MEEYLEDNYSLETHLDKITKLFTDFEKTDNLTKKIKLRGEIQNELKKIKNSMTKCKDFLENSDNEKILDNINSDEVNNYKKLIKSIEKMDELELINQILEYKKVESKINSVKENLLN